MPPILDPTSFTTPREKLELLAYMGTQKRVQSRGTVRKYVAKALTDSIPLSLANLMSGQFETATSNKISRYILRAKIQSSLYHNKDPHAMLPDPCLPVYASKPNKAIALIKLHSLCITPKSFGHGDSEQINKGDIIEISCKIDRQTGQPMVGFATITKIIKRAPPLTVSEVQPCVDLTAMFDYKSVSMNLGTYPGAASGASPGHRGLGPTAATEVIPSTFFNTLLTGSVGSYPAKVTNASDVVIIQAHAPTTSGWSITSRPQTNRCITSVDPPRCSPHNGVDIAAPMRTQLYATYPGVITYSPSSFPTSHKVNAVATITSKIEFADGSTKTIAIKYMHMSAYDAGTPNNSIVQQGQKIGLSGGDPSTPGSGGPAWSSGPHLHWEVRVDGVVQASHYLYRATDTAASSAPAVDVAEEILDDGWSAYF
tara:strand:- start:141 stop:1418 length:1278 start_codon:yes stop_codon:yes gene_type:complete